MSQGRAPITACWQQSIIEFSLLSGAGMWTGRDRKGVWVALGQCGAVSGGPGQGGGAGPLPERPSGGCQQRPATELA